MLTQIPLSVLIVDDEPLARLRLRSLLEACRDPHAVVAAEASGATAALAWLQSHACELVLLDVQMPGLSGLQLAEQLRSLPVPPLVVFVTAHAEHALEAFDREAVDYLTKPVRPERLQAALARAAQRRLERDAVAKQSTAADDAHDVLHITDRGRLVRLPWSEVLYLRAEAKYLTVRTASSRYLMDGVLSEYEQRLEGRFLRIHRNALVAKAAVRELDRHLMLEGTETGPTPLDPAHEPLETWAVRVAPVNEWLAVSRRQLSAVREALRAQAG
jgi:two-component system response regulator AlgR